MKRMLEKEVSEGSPSITSPRLRQTQNTHLHCSLALLSSDKRLRQSSLMTPSSNPENSPTLICPEAQACEHLRGYWFWCQRSSFLFCSFDFFFVCVHSSKVGWTFSVYSSMSFKIGINPCNDNYSPISQNIVCSCCPLSSCTLSPHLDSGNHWSILISMVLSFGECHINESFRE